MMFFFLVEEGCDAVLCISDFYIYTHTMTTKHLSQHCQKHFGRGNYLLLKTSETYSKRKGYLLKRKQKKNIEWYLKMHKIELPGKFRL